MTDISKTARLDLIVAGGDELDGPAGPLAAYLRALEARVRTLERRLSPVPLMTAADAARYARVNVETILRAVRAGELSVAGDRKRRAAPHGALVAVPRRPISVDDNRLRACNAKHQRRTRRRLAPPSSGAGGVQDPAGRGRAVREHVGEPAADQTSRHCIGGRAVVQSQDQARSMDRSGRLSWVPGCLTRVRSYPRLAPRRRMPTRRSALRKRLSSSRLPPLVVAHRRSTAGWPFSGKCRRSAAAWHGASRDCGEVLRAGIDEPGTAGTLTRLGVWRRVRFWNRKRLRAWVCL
jgi:hypothetical protein